jgi:hypothetical protein
MRCRGSREVDTGGNELGDNLAIDDTIDWDNGWGVEFSRSIESQGWDKSEYYNLYARQDKQALNQDATALGNMAK